MKLLRAIDDYFGGDGACWVPLWMLIIALVLFSIFGAER